MYSEALSLLLRRKTDEGKYGKWRRIYFNGVFRNFGTFLFNWNLSTIADWTTEKWIEEDGGASSSISTTTTWKDSFGNTQTTTTSIPSKNKDDDLGQSIIQFTDQINQEYNLTGIIIKRSH